MRLVHLGLGNFFRAHQAWFTATAPDAAEWGYAAFTGRRPEAATVLTEQDGLCTLVTRSDDGDRFTTVGSVARALPAADHEAWLAAVAAPQVAAVTLTVTEAAYRHGPSGRFDLDDRDVRADAATLRAAVSVLRTAASARAGPSLAPASGWTGSGDLRTVTGRLVAGLAERRRREGGPLALVPCDNLPRNGTVLAQSVRSLASSVDRGLASWIDESVSFVSTVVDRITPRTTAADVELVARATGFDDRCPVVTEPFAEWILAGDFPAGRPAWDAAGAMLVDDVEPFEQRKLWLLNGAHSLLAYAGALRGHTTVAEAISDDVCRAWVEQWWDDASPWLDRPAAEVAAYRETLLARLANRRIEHRLAQIAADGSEKLPVRVLPVVRAARAAGELPPGAVRVLAAWICHLRGLGTPVDDPGAAQLRGDATGALRSAVPRTLAALDEELADDGDLVGTVAAQTEELSSSVEL